MSVLEPPSDGDAAGPGRNSSHARALAAGVAVGDQVDQVGLFHLDFGTERWTWSPEVWRIHGLDPRHSTLDTELVLAHLHPEDRQRVLDVIEEARATTSTFSTRHRIITADGQTKVVITIGDVLSSAGGSTAELHGYLVDLGPESDVDNVGAASEAQHLRLAMASRATIEQAKGMIMHAYGCTATEAFQVLVTASQRTNRKLRELTEELAAAMTTGRMLPQECRAILDRELLRPGGAGQYDDPPGER